jgi:hypothetical protein
MNRSNTTLDEFEEMIHNMFNMPKKHSLFLARKKPSCFARPWRLPTIPVCPTAAWNLLQGSRRGADPWSLGLMANWDSLEKVIYIYIILIGGLEPFSFFHILGMSSSQLTKSFFLEG